MTAWNDRVRAQPMFDILARARERESSGQRVIHFEIGETSGFVNSALLEALRAELEVTPLNYSPSLGEPTLRAAISTWLSTVSNLHVSSENVAISPANALVLQSLTCVASMGDCVLIPDPGFPTYELAADFLGLVPIRYSTGVESSITDEIERIEREVRGRRICAAIICNPNNPTGRFLPWDRFSTLFQFCKSHDITLISDETYVNLILEDTKNDLLIPESENVIRIRSASKEFGAPALRIGYAIGTTDAIERIGRSSSLIYSCLPSFAQIAMSNFLLTPEPIRFISGMKKEMAERFQILESRPTFVSREERIGSRAGFYTMLNVGDDRSFFEFVLTKHGLATCPGSVFGPSAKGSVRLSLAGSRVDFDDGIELLENALVEWGTNEAS